MMFMLYHTQGELTITVDMEDLGNALFLDAVPETWSLRAYPSLMSLGLWYADLLLRIKELENWTADFQVRPSEQFDILMYYLQNIINLVNLSNYYFNIVYFMRPERFRGQHFQGACKAPVGPKFSLIISNLHVYIHVVYNLRVPLIWNIQGPQIFTSVYMYIFIYLQLPNAVWLAGFFNPQSFLTAIMQQMARKNEWPLDRMCLQCDVTKKNKEDMGGPPREGAYIHGMFMEGARWDIQTGMINEARLKELAPPMPVMFIKAIPVDRQDTRNVYECPVYKTKSRGPTYVWTFNLKTKERPARWVLGGVAMLLQV